jgi:hypothetical protein
MAKHDLLKLPDHFEGNTYAYESDPVKKAKKKAKQ